MRVAASGLNQLCCSAQRYATWAEFALELSRAGQLVLPPGAIPDSERFVALKAVPMLASLADSELWELARAGKWKRLEKGKQIVLNGGGKTIACGTCHGATLQGIVNIPAIAGRSPSYMMRQMWDMKMGTRKGPMTQLMKPVVANLSQDDMLNVVAYLASINPPAAPTTTSSR